jgi:hypothetical protein
LDKVKKTKVKKNLKNCEREKARRLDYAKAGKTGEGDRGPL